MFTKTTKSAAGTSFHGTIARATYLQLVALLGEPQLNDGSFDGKVQKQWVLEDTEGRVLTVYDFKEERNVEVGNIHWHIGSNGSLHEPKGPEERLALYITQGIR
jgi:hypothetical protein